MSTSDVTNPASPKVAVIGGGIAGLVAAWELARAGAHVTLVERCAQLGGRVCSGEIDGIRFDLGPESYAIRGGEVERLLMDLGLGDQIAATAGGRSWVVGAESAAPLPASGAIGIPARPLSAETRRVIGLWGALRCLFEPWLPTRVGQHETSLGGLVGARLGTRTLERIVSPVVRGVYSSSPMLLPIEAIPGLAKTYAEHGSLRVAARRHRGSVRASGAAVAGVSGGVYTLVQRLIEELDLLGVRVCLETAVTEVRSDPQGCRVLVTSDAEEEADMVLVTVPGIHQSHEPQESFGQAGDVDNAKPDQPSQKNEEDATVEVIALMLDDSRLNAAPRGTGALVSEGARRASPVIHAKALTHVNIKWEWLAAQLPEHRHLIRLSYGEHGNPPVTIGTSDDDALKIALADASAILGVDLDLGSVVGMKRQTHTIRRWRPIQRDSSEQEPGSRATPQRVFCAGEWVAGTGLAAVVPSARATAQRMLVTAGAAPAAEPHQTCLPQKLNHQHKGVTYEHRSRR